MTSFTTIRRVPHTPLQMLDLVADVERYPEFLPLCEALRVRSRKEHNGREILVADMTAGYGSIREHFTSRVTIERGATPPRILVEYVDGPFRHLENRWTFRPAGEAGRHCDVEFFIDYEFKSLMLQLLLGAMFDRAFQKFSAAFEERARRMYAPAAAAPEVRGALA